MVTSEIIANCFNFKHAGFYKEEEATSLPDYGDAAIEKLSALLSKIDDADAGPEEYVNIDKDLAVSGEASVDTIVDSINEREQSPDDDDSDEAPLPPVTNKDVNTALETLKHIALQHKDGSVLFDMLCQVEDKVYNMASGNKRQTGIRDYFTQSKPNS